jgi:hypothetical protein
VICSQPLKIAFQLNFFTDTTTLSIMMFNRTTLSMKGLFATLGINDAQHNNIVIMLSAVKLSVVFNYCSAEYLIAECHNAECHNAE